MVQVQIPQTALRNWYTFLDRIRETREQVRSFGKSLQQSSFRPAEDHGHQTTRQDNVRAGLRRDATGRRHGIGEGVHLGLRRRFRLGLLFGLVLLVVSFGFVFLVLVLVFMLVPVEIDQ